MRRILASMLVVLVATVTLAGTALAQPKPDFKLGFKALADQIPDIVGEPIEEERYGPNGDSLQRTTTGLMVWRKADNWTAFTNGSRTWINGPEGVQERGNDERFTWEADAPATGGLPSASQPPSAPPEVDWKAYERPELGFRISVPSSWTLMVAGSGPPEQPATLYPDSYYVFGAFDAGPRARGEDYGYVLVDIGELPPGKTAEDGIRTKIEGLDADPGVVKPVSRQQVATRSGEAVQLRWQEKRVFEGKTYTSTSLWHLFLRGSQAYLVTGVAIGERLESYVSILDRLGQQFEILAPASTAAQQPSSAPAPVPGGPFTPDMKAMDPQNEGPGATLNQLLLDIDKEWAGSWRWRPQRPVTVYLYADANQMAGDADRVLGAQLPAEYRDWLVPEEAGSFKDARGGWTVLMVVKGASWGVPWEQIKARHHLVHEYAHVMVADRDATNLPIWFREGIAEYAAFARDPQAVAAFGRVNAATALYNISLLPGSNPAIYPSLRQLDPKNWASLEASGEAGKRSAHGIAYMAVKYLVDRVGTERVAQVLQATAAGEAFDAALQRVTGYTVDQLDTEYRSTISRAGWTR